MWRLRCRLFLPFFRSFGLGRTGFLLNGLHRVRVRLEDEALGPASDLELCMSSTGGLFLLGAADDVDLALNYDTLEPLMMDQIGGFGSPVRIEPQHRRQERRNRLCFFFREQVLVVQNRGQRPETKLVYMP